MAQTLHPPSPFLCQASLIENYALPIEASLSLMVLITVLQANNTSFLSLHHTLKKARFAIGDSFHPGHCYQKNLLKIFLSEFHCSESQRLDIAYYLQPDSVAPLRAFRSFFPVFSSPLFILLHRFLHLMFWILRSPITCVFALDLRMLLCSLRVIIAAVLGQFPNYFRTNRFLLFPNFQYSRASLVTQW